MTIDSAWLFRIKSAQRDLVSACDGEVESAGLTGYGKSTVNRWANPEDPTLMPLGAIKILETKCGEPLVTLVMAEATGRRLTDPDESRSSDVNVMLSFSELVRQVAKLTNAYALAIADGKMTPAEASRLDRIAYQMQRASSDMRTTFAVIKAMGGADADLSFGGGPE